MNLTELITQWIGEEKEIEGHSLFAEGYNEALYDLKSKIPDLIEQIESMYFDYARHEQAKFLDGFAHPKDCEECNKI